MAATKNPAVRLHHILDEIDNLAEALAGATAESFAQSYVLRRVSEHAVLIISEAVKALPADLTDAYPAIDWRAIRDIGNVLRHEYHEVDTRVLWRIVRDRLPEVRAVTIQMLTAID